MSDPREDFLGIARPDIGEQEIAEILDVLRSGWLTSGPRVESFGAALARYVGAPHICCLNSCSAGLLLALRLLDAGAGDEVIVPANTFAACANVVEHCSATPVFADCDPATGLLDLDHAQSLVGPRTRALMAVHLGGRPLDLDALAALRDRHGVAIVEDAAHAIGAEWRGRRVGAWGNLCAFSFHATKNMTTIEGGALAVLDADQSERVQRLALHGLSRSAWSRHGTAGPAQYDVSEPGYKLGMNDVSAAIGIHQLRRLDGWIARREHLSRAYDERLAHLPLEFAPAPPAGMRHARHLYAVLVRADAPKNRDKVARELRARNVGTSVHFNGIHLHRYYRERYRLRPVEFPNSTDWSARTLTLPLHTGMSEDDVDYVCAALADIFAGVAASA